MTSLVVIGGAAYLGSLAALAFGMRRRHRSTERRRCAAWAESAGAEPLAERGELGAVVERLADHTADLKRRATRARATEVRLRVSEESARRLQSILETLQDGVLVFEDGERLAYANATARRLLRCTDEKAPSLSGARCEPALLESVRDVLRADLARGVCSRKVDLAGARDGHRSLWRVRGLGDESGSRVAPAHARAVVLLEDVTFEEASARMKSEFVYGVSHELKTPLTSIQAALEMLVEEGGESSAPEDRARLLRLAHGESVRLARMIQELLDLARVEAGLTQVRRESVPTSELLRELYEVHRPLAERKAIALEWRISEYVPALRGDKELLRQAFVNLIGNAIKYTREGGTVAVSAMLEGEELLVEIVDDGIGIGTADLPRIFDKFFRASQAKSSRIPGTGLGLPLARYIVESHGGRIEVASTLGEGSAFRVHLPVGSSAEGEPACKLASVGNWEGERP